MPIEQVFAKFKHLLRKVAARTVEAVYAAIGQLRQLLLPKNSPLPEAVEFLAPDLRNTGKPVACRRVLGPQQSKKRPPLLMQCHTSHT